MTIFQLLPDDQGDTESVCIHTMSATVVALVHDLYPAIECELGFAVGAWEGDVSPEIGQKYELGFGLGQLALGCSMVSCMPGFSFNANEESTMLSGRIEYIEDDDLYNFWITKDISIDLEKPLIHFDTGQWVQVKLNYEGLRIIPNPDRLSLARKREM